MQGEIFKTAQGTGKRESELSELYNARQRRREWKQQEKSGQKGNPGKPRSKEYVEAVQKLDMAEHVQSRKKLEKIISTLKNEVLELEIPEKLLGYVAVCYLGQPYEVHTLDMEGQIVKHYKEGQALPNGLERARNIAIRGEYAFVEVYADCCRGVGVNGSVTVIAC